MKRNIIEIDENKCNGCGQCVPNCQEGALQIIDGKARLISDLFCDGLGACIGECPLGAIKVVEREAEPYDERKVIENIAKQGESTIKAHLKHLQEHSQCKLFKIAAEYLKEQNIPVPNLNNGDDDKLPCGCPSSLAQKFPVKSAQDFAGGVSALQQWPVQLKLLNPMAEYFENADLLISADCVGYAYGAFHKDFLNGKILIVFCPKLDSDIQGYIDKLSEIFTVNQVKSITVLKMEVPCCGGTVSIVEEALKNTQKEIPLTVKTIKLDGTIN